MKLRVVFICLFLAAIASLSVPDQNGKEKIRIRNWSFRWDVVETGNALFKIVKTEDAIYTQLLSTSVMSSGNVRLTPRQAENVAELLRNSEMELNLLREKGGASEETVRKEVKLDGGIKVVYYYDPTRGGRIYVSEDRLMSMSTGVSLDVTEAETMAEQMGKAVELCKVVDSRVRPNN